MVGWLSSALLDPSAWAGATMPPAPKRSAAVAVCSNSPFAATHMARASGDRVPTGQRVRRFIYPHIIALANHTHAITCFIVLFPYILHFIVISTNCNLNVEFTQSFNGLIMCIFCAVFANVDFVSHSWPVSWAHLCPLKLLSDGSLKVSDHTVPILLRNSCDDHRHNM